MKRLWAIAIALALVLVLSLSLLPLQAGADLGDYNDYDSGSYDSYDSYDSGSSWDDDDDYSGSSGSWSSSGSSSGGSGEPLAPGTFTVIIVGGIVYVIIRIAKNKSTAKKPSPPTGAGPVVQNHTNRIVPTMQQGDPQFSSDKFIAWVKEVFFTLQYAWMERDWEKVRPFEKEELYKQHEMQIKQYIDGGRINVLERININQAYLQRYVRDSQYEYLTVFLQVRMTDYIKDEKTGAVLKGSPDKDCHMKYLYTFMRRTGVLTDPALSNKSTTNCPNCGAPTQITSAGKCEYCDSVITTGSFDWVLSNIDGVKAHTVVDNSGVIMRDV